MPQPYFYVCVTRPQGLMCGKIAGAVYESQFFLYLCGVERFGCLQTTLHDIAPEGRGV